MTAPASRHLAASLLDKTRQKIAAPERWVQSSYALNEHGEDVSELSLKACRWCALGALNAVCPWANASPETRRLVEESLAREAGLDVALVGQQAHRMRAILRFNDTHSHPEVMAWMDRARRALQRPP